MSTHRLSLRATLPVLFALVAGAAGCETEMEMLPTEFISLAYVVMPSGASTVEKPLVLPIQSALTVCDRAGKIISISAAEGLASVTINLKGAATSPAQLALAINSNTKGAAEMLIK